MVEPSPVKRALFVSVPFLLLFLVWAAAEVTLRYVFPPKDGLELLLAAPQQQKAFLDPHEARAFRADPLLLWSLKPNLDRALWNLTLVSTNSEGLRYAHEVGPKTSGGFRILCLGDSVTFGFRVPRVLPRAPQDYNRAAKPYPALLEDALRAANPGRGIEVIPLAVPGYTSHQGLAWLRRDIARYAPDVVTACFGWNDINHRARTDRQTMSTSRWAVGTRWLLSNSQVSIRLGLLAREMAPRAQPPEAGQTMRVPTNEYVENLLEIADVSRAHGAVPVFIGPVYRDRTAHPPEGDEIAVHRAALRTAAVDHQIPYLEIAALTEEAHPGNDPLFEEHIHPNAKGHRLMAESLLLLLAQKKLLGDLRVEIAGPGVRSELVQETGR